MTCHAFVVIRTPQPEHTHSTTVQRTEFVLVNVTMQNVGKTNRLVVTLETIYTQQGH